MVEEIRKAGESGVLGRWSKRKRACRTLVKGVLNSRKAEMGEEEGEEEQTQMVVEEDAKEWRKW